MKLATAAIVLSALIASPVAAQDLVTVEVKTNSAELASAQGRAALEARIEATARQACAIETASRYNYGRTVVDLQCVAEARAAALAEVDRLVAVAELEGRQIASN